MLIANQGNSRLQIAHAVQAQTAENAAHGGPAQPRGLGNVVPGEAPRWLITPAWAFLSAVYSPTTVIVTVPTLFTPL